MPYSVFTQDQLLAAKRRQYGLAREGVVQGRNNTGMRLSARIDPVLHLHLSQQGRTSDPDYNKWVLKEHPELRVDYKPGDLIHAEPVGRPTTRFGKASRRFVPGRGWIEYDKAATMDDTLGNPAMGSEDASLTVEQVAQELGKLHKEPIHG